MERFDRTIKLFGNENFEKFQNTKLILLGVGGIGSFALDSLYRTGFTQITIVEHSGVGEIITHWRMSEFYYWNLAINPINNIFVFYRHSK